MLKTESYKGLNSYVCFDPCDERFLLGTLVGPVEYAYVAPAGAVKRHTLGTTV